MRIAISARSLDIQSGGAKEAIRKIVELVPKTDTNPDHKYYVYFDNEEIFKLYESSKYFTPRLIKLSFGFKSISKLIWDHLVLPAYMRRDQIDLGLFPKNIKPMTWFGKSIVLTYDLAYFIPELSAYEKFDTMYMKLMMPLSLRSSDRIISISNSTANDIKKFIPKINPDKIKVIHLDAVYKPNLVRIDIRKKFNLPESPYIFLSASLSPRKNIERAILAFAKVKNKIPHNLVITGGKAWGNNYVQDLLSKHQLESRFYKLGFVEDDLMPSVYAQADIYFHPSLYEGFGITLLEAMHAGLPVLASNVTSHPEVVEEAGLLFDPYDIDEMAAKLLLVASDKNLRAKLIERGNKQIKKFSWMKFAQEYVDVLNELENTINNKANS